MSENDKKKTTDPNEKKNETTKTFNDEHIDDLAKLTALNARGDHMQFSLGETTEVRYGEKPDIVNGILTLDCGFLGAPQFRIRMARHKWVFENCNLKTKTLINGTPVENQNPVELRNRSLIRIIDGNSSQEIQADHHLFFRCAPSVFLRIRGAEKP